MTFVRFISFFGFGITIACGGDVFTTSGDSGTDADSASVCPSSPPAVDSSCAGKTTMLMCEYGSNPDMTCNQLFTCNGGAWIDASTGTACTPQSSCPATYASITEGATCTPQSLMCAYAQGECICTTGFGELKDVPAWSCIPATSGCPSPRPDIGSACTPDPSNEECDYGACLGGVALSCTSGAWQQVLTTCPG